MGWDFIYVVRRSYLSDDNCGDMYIQTVSGDWEWLCYTYEPPWTPFHTGPLSCKSRNYFSRIRIGTYELKPRTDGIKGWRLELQNTGHRTYIQIHRANASMSTEGCILPISFHNLSESKLKEGDLLIQEKSVALMNKIQKTYEELKIEKEGNPLLEISANLPPKNIFLGSSRYA